MDVRDAYKFARYQGEGDQAAAEFVEWATTTEWSAGTSISEMYRTWRFDATRERVTDGS